MEPIPSKVIYVGSIPYDQTEEQILDIFRSVGPVANFRLVFDKDSGKSKGFGFVEYHDPETAASAVRNLNNYSIGSRNLRVDFSHETSITSPSSFPSSNDSTDLPPLPSGTMPPPGVPAHEAIGKTLMTLTRDQMLDIILDMKTMSQNNPSLAQSLLKSSPQLSYMIVQSMIMMDIIDNNAVISLVGQDLQQPQPYQQQQPPRNTQQYNNNSGSEQQENKGNTTPVLNSSSQVNSPNNFQSFSNSNTESNNAASWPQSQQQASDGSDLNQQATIIRQIMQLTDEQVALLPDDQRQVLEVLRKRVQNGEISL